MTDVQKGRLARGLSKISQVLGVVGAGSIIGFLVVKTLICIYQEYVTDRTEFIHGLVGLIVIGAAFCIFALAGMKIDQFIDKYKDVSQESSLQ